MQKYSSEAQKAWQADAIHTTHQVIARFGDNRFNKNEQITASSTKQMNRGLPDAFGPTVLPFWSPNDAFNGKRRNTMKFAVCDQGARVDQNYRCIYVDYTQTETPEYQRGWWSANKSGADTTFSPYEWLQDVFEPRNVNTIELWLDDAYPNIGNFEVFYSPGSSYVPGATTTDPVTNITGPGPGTTSTWVSLGAVTSPQGFPLANGSTVTVPAGFGIDTAKTYTVYWVTGPVTTGGVEFKDSSGNVAAFGYTLDQLAVQFGLTGQQLAAANNVTYTNPYRLSWTLPTTNICGLKINIYSTQQPYQFARIIQLNGALISDISADVVSFTVNQDKDEYKNTVPVGTTRANSANLVLQNVTQNYSPENASGPYYPYVTGGTELDISVGVDLNQGVGTPSYEYVKLGHFYADTWNANSSGFTTTASCTDYSRFLINQKLLNFGKMWLNTNIAQVWRDLMARMGKAPDEIFIDQYALTTFDAVFLKDKIVWQFMAEVAFADQGMFGFDENNNFFYTSYESLYSSLHGSPTSTTALDTTVYDFNDTSNIISATEETELLINSVVANVYNYKSGDTTTQKLWGLSGDTALAWATLANNITTTMGGSPQHPNDNPNDRINVNENLDNIPLYFDSNNKPVYATTLGGVGGFPWAGGPPLEIVISNPNFYGESITSGYNSGGYLYIDDEIIQYGARDSSGFYQLTRGILDTPVQNHSAGAYIGEVAVFNPLNFSNSPAYYINQPHCTAIDDIHEITQGKYGPLAKYLIFRPNAFGAQLAIGNLGKHYVLLQGTASSNQPYTNGPLDWYTNISGKAIVPKASKQEIGGPPIGRATSTGRFTRYIKRYGIQETVIDNPWVQSVARAQYLCNLYLYEYKNPRQLINISCVPFPYLQLSDQISISSSPSLGITNKTYNIVGIDYSYDGGLTANILARETLASAPNV